jgi:hypothetical protein
MKLALIIYYYRSAYFIITNLPRSGAKTLKVSYFIIFVKNHQRFLNSYQNLLKMNHDLVLNV